MPTISTPDGHAPPPRRISMTAIVTVVLAVLLIWLLLARPSWLGFGDHDPVAMDAQRTASALAAKSREAAVQADDAAPDVAIASPSPSTSPAPDESAAASAIGPNPDCADTVVELPKHYLAQSTRLPADVDSAYTPFPAYQAAGADAVVYMGAHVPVEAADSWIGSVYCNDMTPFFDPDPAFNALGINGGAKYVQQLVDARPHLIGAFIVQQYGNPKGTAAAVNERVKAIQDLNLSIPVITIHDQMSPNFKVNLALSKKFHGDRNTIGYYPYTGSRKYGDESTLRGNAKVEKSINGAAATAAVQEFDWWRSDPVTAELFGFAKSPVITPRDVARMATAQLRGGASSVILIGLEAKKPQTDVDNTKGWVVPCIEAVKAANPVLGTDD